ncbi:type II secretion system protein D [Thiobacillus denitrificans ATCC 25259]|uniref:Type II secretion system protein D n=1 Tax=Thiobacillus denitrificans (strain ATCC 25259 / T1) TaxID=292415 RepID=Q3SIY3_THIDA|nr:secretin and TonB N-terminal domain-containing protein [Thiobacillus denitrificans]AAZ97392.1 type II secretion system protein D [Thiobacillus denitrificans ATCC 25259]
MSFHPSPLLTALVAFSLTACAGTGLKEGRKLIDAGQPEAGIARLRTALAEEPDNIKLKAYYHTQRERIASELLVRAQQDVHAARFDAAETKLDSVLEMHPENPRALALRANLETARRHEAALQQANKALAAGKVDAAAQAAREILAQAPGHAGALALLRQTQAAHAPDELAMRRLGPAFHKPITLEFRDAPLRNVFDMIARQSGLNFVFDKDVRLDTKATLFARNTPIDEAVDMLLMTGQLSKKVVNANTLLIYPDQPQKQKAYQELMVKSFYLGNADAKATMAMLRTLVKAKDLHVDERLNLLVMRDTPDAIRLAERIVAVQDLAEPEVMLEVEVLEVKRGRLLDLGIQYPTNFSLLNLPPATSSTIGPGGVVTNTTPPPSVLTVESLKNITASQIAISPTPGVDLRKQDSDVNILANPRIRVKNREKAKIHIGDKVPVITSNTTSTGVVSESVSYLDVGLKLDVEPSVLMREDVQIRVGLEVSNIVREIRSGNGTLTYQIGTRNAGTTLRLKDGETQVLAGLISDEDRSTASRIPGLGDLPLIGRLFSSQRDERNKTEIVLLITPRVLRSDATRLPALTEFRGGTENAIGGGGAVPFSAPALPEASQPPLPDEGPTSPSAIAPAPESEIPPAPDTFGTPSVPVPQIPAPPDAAD